LTAEDQTGVFRENANNDEWIGDLGDAMQTAGRRSDACTLWRRAQQIDPNDGEWRTKVGNCDGTSGSSARSSSPPPATTSTGARSSSPPPAATLSNAALAQAATLTSAEQTRLLRSHLSDDEWVGDLGDRLQSVRPGDACYLWRTASALDPGDGEWTRKLGACGPDETPVISSSKHWNQLQRSGVLTAAEQTQMFSSIRSDDERLGDVGDLLQDLGRGSDACALWRAAQALDPADGEWRSNLERNCQ
jgi:hypothetical protein